MAASGVFHIPIFLLADQFCSPASLHVQVYEDCACCHILQHTCIGNDGQSGSPMWETSTFNLDSILTGKVVFLFLAFRLFFNLTSACMP